MGEGAQLGRQSAAGRAGLDSVWDQGRKETGVPATRRRTSTAMQEWPLLILAIALVSAICVPLWQWTTRSDTDTPVLTGERIGRMLLGPEQIACYAAFTWACFILGMRYRELRRQRRAFGLDLLPGEEGLRILPDDAGPLQRRVEQVGERGGPYVLANMMRLALCKFAISRSPQDAGDTVRTQADVELGRMATSMATVNYLAWAIPALGFVGTVRGIGMALTIAPSLTDESLPNFLNVTTKSLAVAFDTTLVALLLSLVLMFLLHAVQRGQENLVLDGQEYCLEHLISRLYDLPAHGNEPAVAETGAPDFGIKGAWQT
jgi:biopolymer transport protein ExbB/TolQ